MVIHFDERDGLSENIAARGQLAFEGTGRYFCNITADPIRYIIFIFVIYPLFPGSASSFIHRSL